MPWFDFFQIYLLCLTFVGLAVNLSHGQDSCNVQQCTVRITGANQNQYPTDAVNRAANSAANPSYRPNVAGRRKRDTHYQKPAKVIDHGKVIVMPPPGQAPKGSPQPGQHGGGGRPEENPYIAAMAPDGTVPIAIFPPFDQKPRYPTKCVIYSQLTDLEDEEESNYGNIPQYKPQYQPSRHPRQAGNYSDEVEFLAREKRASIFDMFTSMFRPQARPSHGARPTSYAAPSPSYGAPAPTYDAPKPTYTTEPPIRTIYRQYGYVCDVVVSIDICKIGQECDKDGNRLNKQNSYSTPVDTYEARRPPPNSGRSEQTCASTQMSCSAANASKSGFQGLDTNNSG